MPKAYARFELFLNEIIHDIASHYPSFPHCCFFFLSARSGLLSICGPEARVTYLYSSTPLFHIKCFLFLSLSTILSLSKALCSFKYLYNICICKKPPLCCVTTSIPSLHALKGLFWSLVYLILAFCLSATFNFGTSFSVHKFS